jgi:hypothetical protein
VANLVEQNHITKAKEIVSETRSDPNLIPLIQESAKHVNAALEAMLAKVVAKKQKVIKVTPPLQWY